MDSQHPHCPIPLSVLSPGGSESARTGPGLPASQAEHVPRAQADLQDLHIRGQWFLL